MDIVKITYFGDAGYASKTRTPRVRAHIVFLFLVFVLLALPLGLSDLSDRLISKGYRALALG